MRGKSVKELFLQNKEWPNLLFGQQLQWLGKKKLARNRGNTSIIEFEIIIVIVFSHFCPNNQQRQKCLAFVCKKNIYCNIYIVRL